MNITRVRPLARWGNSGDAGAVLLPFCLASPVAVGFLHRSHTMGIFSFFGNKGKKSGGRRSTCRLAVEPLEDRFLPSANVISGYVFNDVNNDGLYEPNLGETPVANAPIQLVNSANQVVGTATTDANGYYEFKTDDTISQAPQSITQTLHFPSTQTDFSLAKLLNQFDPSLGQLQEIDITQNGTITSTIKVENTSPTSSATIQATVSGTMSLSGPGFTSQLDLSANAGSFNASAYDNVLD